MPDYWKKAEEAAKTGAHVAAVLYMALGAEEHRGSDYHTAYWQDSVRNLLNYRGKLKKKEDRRAVEEFCAIRHGTVLSRMGFDVDITAKLQSPDIEIE